MKTKLLFLSLFTALLFFAPAVHSQQITRKAKDSAINAVTKFITWTSLPSKTKSIVLSFKKGTGTPAATVTLEYRVDTIAAVWQHADSSFSTYTITGDSATFIWTIPTLFFNGARIKIVPTGTQKTYVWAAYMRRPDE